MGLISLRACCLLLCLHVAYSLANSTYDEDDIWTRSDLNKLMGITRRTSSAKLEWTISGACPNVNSLTSFGGGFSEFYGAGGSTYIARPNGIVQTAFNTLYPGYGETGEWILQPKGNNMYREKSSGRLNLSILMSKLWASTILRDNMVTVLGYLVNLPDNPLTSELYNSLYHIYDTVRFRRLKTIKIVHVLQKMADASPRIQFLFLFQEVKKIIPKYLQSSVSVWIQALREMEVDISSIIRPKGGPLIVDFMAGIDSTVLDCLDKPLHFKTDTVSRVSPAISDMMGPLFGLVFAAIQDGSLKLTQPLFALILLHRPHNGIIPQREETERYLTDVLKLSNVEHWEEIIKVVTTEDLKDPFSLILKVLGKISIQEDVDPLIKEDARYVVSYVKRIISTYANKHYSISSLVLSQPTIDILLLLKSIMPIEYPDEVVDIKSRIEYYILNGYLDVEFVIKGFNRYDHTKPINVLIAILTRIQRRLPKLPHEIISCVKYLKLYLVFKKFLCSMSPTVPTELVDITSFTHAFDSPRIPREIVLKVQELATYLPNEDISWQQVTKEVPIQECSRPRQCIVSIIMRVIEGGYLINSPSHELMIDFLKHLDRNGDPIVEGEGGKKTTVCIETNTLQMSTKTTTTESTMKMIVHGPSTSEDKVSLRATKFEMSTDAPETFHHNTTALGTFTTGSKSPQLSGDGWEVSGLKFQGAHIHGWENARQVKTPGMKVTTANKGFVSREYIYNGPDSTPFHGGVIYPPDLISKGHFKGQITSKETIQKILGFSSTPNSLFSPGNMPFKSAVENQMFLLPFITQNKNVNMKEVDIAQVQKFIIEINVELPLMTAYCEHEPPSISHPETLLPLTRIGTLPDMKLRCLRLFLGLTNLYDILGKDFKPEAYSKKGILLKAIIRFALKTEFVMKNIVLRHVAQFYLKYMEVNANKEGKDKIIICLICLKNALPYPKNRNDAAIIKVVQKFLSNPQLYPQLEKSLGNNVKYQTKGTMLKHVLESSLTLDYVRVNRVLERSINATINRVYIDGYGAQAIEYTFSYREIITKQVDVYSVLKTLNHAVMKDNTVAQAALKTFINFVIKDFNPAIYLKGFDVEKYTSKGALLQGCFEFLLQKIGISPKVKESIFTLMPYIRLIGSGASPVDYVKN